MTENFHLFLNVIVYFLNFSGIICMMFIVTLNFHHLEMIGHIISNWKLSPINNINTIDFAIKDATSGSCSNTCYNFFRL
jgi:hypothetical protein